MKKWLALALVALLGILAVGCPTKSTPSPYSAYATANPDAYKAPPRPTLPPGVTTFVVYGNPDSMIYHHPPDSPSAQAPCRKLSRSKAIRFNSPAEARAAGYRPCETRGCNLP